MRPSYKCSIIKKGGVGPWGPIDNALLLSTSSWLEPSSSPSSSPAWLLKRVGILTTFKSFAEFAKKPNRHHPKNEQDWIGAALPAKKFSPQHPARPCFQGSKLTGSKESSELSISRRRPKFLTDDFEDYSYILLNSESES
jgi:hypothetical protein